MAISAFSGQHLTKRSRLAILLACVAAWSAPGGASYDLCGATIVADLQLVHDLTCSGDGLIVGADGIKLKLNGHTITGSGTGVGIDVTGHDNVSISGGTVRNFATGVRTNNSSDIVIKDTAFVENGDGVDLQAGSLGNTVKENDFRGNRARGIMVRGSSSDHVIKENSFTGNNVGILLFGALDSTVKENILSEQLLAAIRVNVFATGNLIIENTVVSNPTGIELIVGTTGNSVIENSIEMNDCGLKGSTAGNTVKENVFVGNLSDTCL